MMMCVQIQRMPPLESSMIALETLTGMDTCLSAEDIFRRMFLESVFLNACVIL